MSRRSWATVKSEIRSFSVLHFITPNIQASQLQKMWNGLNSPLLLYRCVVIDSSFECVSQLLAPFERESCPFHHVVPTQLIELTTRHIVTGRMYAGLLDYDKQQIACIEILVDSWQSRMQNVFHVHINSYGKTVKNVVVLRRPMLMLMCRGSSATALSYIYIA